jgi:pimeloyl-ACP methyl ester carboxylesterase
MTAEKDDIGVSMSRRHIMTAGMVGTLAGAAGLAVTAAPAQANDSMKGLTMPIPPQAPMTEGTADLGTTKLWYWDTGGTGEAVVFLHPGSGSGEFYPHQQPVFAKAGYRAISYSRRGQNKSETGSDADTYFAADDLLNLMTYLKIDKFHAVGNALGGYIGLDIAMSHPDRLRSLTLACSMMGISEPEFAKVLQSLRPKAFGDLPMEVKELGPSYRAAKPRGCRGVEEIARSVRNAQPRPAAQQVHLADPRHAEGADAARHRRCRSVDPALPAAAGGRKDSEQQGRDHRGLGPWRAVGAARDFQHHRARLHPLQRGAVKPPDHDS